MRIFLGEYGGFMVEFIAGSAVIVTAAVIWLLIRNYMDAIVFLLV